MRATYLSLALILVSLPMWARLDVYIIQTQGDQTSYLSDLATRLTGVSPSLHGISADSAFSRISRRPEPVLNGYCDDLLAPTFTDSLRLRSPQSAVYAVGLNAPTACLMAGHAATACCWLDKTDTLCRWTTSPYYLGGLPSSAKRLNGHITPQSANERVTELALALQQDFYLGQSAGIRDVLLLQVDAASPQSASALTALRDTLEQRLKTDTLRWTVWTLHDTNALPATDNTDAFHLAPRPFSTDRAMALTSTYLVALYGNHRWFDGGFRNALYLNRDIIEQEHLSLITIRQQVAEFLMRFEGIRYACPSSDAYLIPDIAPTIHKRFVGDVVFFLQPNYILVP